MDQFGSHTRDAPLPAPAVRPASKNGEGIPTRVSDTWSATSMTGRIVRASPNLTVVNQFGTITMDVMRPDLLMVPTAKSLRGSAPAAAAADHRPLPVLQGQGVEGDAEVRQDRT